MKKKLKTYLINVDLKNLIINNYASIEDYFWTTANCRIATAKRDVF